MRYIDADKLLDEVQTESGCIDFSMTATDIRKMIIEQPTADVVEVVRCKDCKYMLQYEQIKACCKVNNFLQEPKCVSNNDFCSRGERKNEIH